MAGQNGPSSLTNTIAGLGGFLSGGSLSRGNMTDALTGGAGAVGRAVGDVVGESIIETGRNFGNFASNLFGKPEQEIIGKKDPMEGMPPGPNLSMQREAMGNENLLANLGQRFEEGGQQALQPPEQQQPNLGMPPAAMTGLGQGFIDESRATLDELISGVMADSQGTFARLQSEAGARGDATVAAMEQATANTDAQMAAIPQTIGGSPSGGLGGGRLSEGALAGSSPMREVQSALGGFLANNQRGRTQAYQNFIGGLEGQTALQAQQARTQADFVQRQQQALLAQEQARRAQDIAQTAAESPQAQAYLNVAGLGDYYVPGMGMDDAQKLVDDLIDLGLAGPNATVGPNGQPLQEEELLLGPGTQQNIDAGLTPGSAKELADIGTDIAMGRVTNEEGIPLNQLGLDDQIEYLKTRVAVVPDDDDRVGMTKAGKVIISETEWSNYLQSLAAGGD